VISVALVLHDQKTIHNSSYSSFANKLANFFTSDSKLEAHIGHAGESGFAQSRNPEQIACMQSI
jgi:hypothetical protein